MSSDGFTSIISMFYAVFHPTEGTKVVCQVPSGSIVPADKSKDSSTLAVPLFDFDSIKNYVIPKPALCNKLVTFKISSYRVVGFPVNIYASHYARNSFSFNLCFVFKYEDDTTPYEGHVKRLGRMFRALEEQSQMLSKADKNHEDFFKPQKDLEPKTWSQTSNYIRIIQDEDVGDEVTFPNQNIKHSESSDPILASIESLVQQIYQDLNNYSECLIPIDSANSVDIKLFPILPPPPELNAYDVPIATVKLETMVDPLWDPTMVRILPFINGVNSIKKISILADADYELTKQCIQHLIHFRSVAVLDVFQFSNCYAPTSEICNFLRDPMMASECQGYVISSTGTFDNLPLQRGHDVASNADMENSSTHSSLLGNERSQMHESQSFSPKTNSYPNHKSAQKTTFVPLPSKATLFFLYRSMNQNLTLRQWYSENSKLLTHIDIRRFVTFGVLRGIIYRVRTYPVSSKFSTSIDLDTTYTNYNDGAHPKKPNYNVSVLPVTNNIGKVSNGLDNDDKLIEAAESNDKFLDLTGLKSERLKKQQEMKLSRLLKKCRDFDMICTDMNIPKKEVVEILTRMGDWSVINS
ncbi:hypothetical protein KL930_005294 [Ogataea haglerorum]|uniref:Nitrogen permease regulator 2 n=1 Tax=Ogataea haglerorum TaxID=1937702 RepID=A0AAN6HY87_9ASCO|nr:uncharacterized protein KL911_004719 [Ogataea haglerorum]KAG7691406.1 hypothetical protein KL915_005302 [Ogataea haglerorum]KAG7691817.1 hypothetical protein KL951_005265 [Ogataea haglerorum]KAG7713022.1 hypothetical protein KL949_005316 [Ogataea haglerorum]KAG7713151.1 hypothetical protein KL913_005278 [Ogataea haglerorum]KAG7723837.1 hypothetical protein KL933_005312 [Ogataea haglerorum]